MEKHLSKKMQLFQLQLLPNFVGIVVVVVVIIGSLSIANAQEFTNDTTTTSNDNPTVPALLNIDSLLAFPNPEQSTSSSNDGGAGGGGNVETVEFSANGFQVTPCSLSDSNKNECIRRLFNDILPKLKGDLPELNMKRIDPYFYRRGIFRYANDGIQGGLLVRNMQIHGISNIQVKTFLGNFTDNSLLVKLGLEVKQLKANGEFKADVKFGGLRLVPKGPFNLTLNNIRCNMLTDGKFVIENGGLRVQLSRLNANVAVGNARVAANGIFSDRNLNGMILNLVNENLMEIIRVGVPATREQWAPILVEHINNFFSDVPLEKILLQ